MAYRCLETCLMCEEWSERTEVMRMRLFYVDMDRNADPTPPKDVMHRDVMAFRAPASIQMQWSGP